MNIEINKSFYNKLWSITNVWDPKRWGHWQIIKDIPATNILEIGPGIRPKVPISGTYFVDISSESLLKLKRLGGIVHQSDLQVKLPFTNDFFDLICCFETLEHVPNDSFLLQEISRMLAPNGIAFLSFPINMDLWNNYDIVVGHCRRYEIKDVDKLFKAANLDIQSFAYLSIPWPSNLISDFLAKIANRYPLLIAYTQNIIDSLPMSPLSKKINLQPWDINTLPTRNQTTLLVSVKKAVY